MLNGFETTGDLVVYRYTTDGVLDEIAERNSRDGGLHKTRNIDSGNSSSDAVSDIDSRDGGVEEVIELRVKLSSKVGTQSLDHCFHELFPGDMRHEFL